MKRIIVVAFVLPLALLLGACSREGGNRLAAPEIPTAGESATLAREASWVSDRSQVSAAAATAAAHPLIRRVLEEAGADRLAYKAEYALRAVGRSARGHVVTITILPFTTGGDETHATFISLLESEGESAVSSAELLWGRDPRADEVGFESITIGGAHGWMREADLRMAPAPGSPLLSPERLNREKFLSCFQLLGPQLCSQGIAISNQIAPTVPYHEAIGCAGGTAVAAISCGAAAMQK